MTIRLISDLVITIHFIWILFILFGFLLALKYPRVAFVHLAGLLFTLILNIGGWYCPLTHLESWLRQHWDPQSVYSGSFIANYLERLIYLRVDPFYLRLGAIIWVSLNLVGHALLFRKRRRSGRKHSEWSGDV